MRDRLRRHQVRIPPEVDETSDPRHVPSFVHSLGQASFTAVVEDTMVEGEVKAAWVPTPTPQAHETIRALTKPAALSSS